MKFLNNLFLLLYIVVYQFLPDDLKASISIGSIYWGFVMIVGLLLCSRISWANLTVGFTLARFSWNCDPVQAPRITKIGIMANSMTNLLVLSLRDSLSLTCSGISIAPNGHEVSHKLHWIHFDGVIVIWYLEIRLNQFRSTPYGQKIGNKVWQ